MRVLKTGRAVLAFILSACASTSTLANEAARAASDASRAAIEKSTHVYATRADQVLQLDRYVARTQQSQGDYRNEMEAFLAKLVWEKQALSIHTVENGTIKKTFGNLAVLYRRYLPPQVQQQLDAPKQ